ncbi:MAG: VCBS repeat-containing protein [Nannocystaceae bacterium]|nr:VCBS repeat-containing protein [Nannocystaceae bacterium]
MAWRAIVGLLPLCAACFSPDGPHGGGEATSSGTVGSGGSEAGSTAAEGGPASGATTTASASATTATSASTDPDGTAGSSSDGGTTTASGARCSDGTFEPGELCFGPIAHVDVDVAPVDVGLGSIDDDAILDLAIAAGGQIAVRAGDGVGGFGSGDTWTTSGPSVAVAPPLDFDGDGFGDATFLAQPLPSVSGESFGWYLREIAGNGQGVDAYNDIVLADFDGGEVDVVYTTAYAAVFQHGFVNGFDWAYGAPVSLPLPGGEGAAGVAAAAFVFDGDAHLDVVVGNRYGAGVDLLQGDGGGTFTLQGSFDVCANGVGSRHVAIGDVDGDGYQDVIATCEDDSLGVAIGVRDGSFQPPVTYDVADGFDLAVGDIAGTGRSDVVVASSQSGDLSIFHGDGDALALGLVLEVGEPIGGVALGDVDSDGALDLAVAVPSGSVAIFKSDP